MPKGCASSLWRVLITSRYGWLSVQYSRCVCSERGRAAARLPLAGSLLCCRQHSISMRMSMAEQISKEEISLRAQCAYTGALIFVREVFEGAKAKLQESSTDVWTNEKDEYVLKETGTLAAFLVTQEVWGRAVQDESDAAAANKLLFSYFKNDLQITANDTFSYAEASQSDAWIMLYGNRIKKAFGVESIILVFELNLLFVDHFQNLMQTTKDAFSLPIEEIEAKMASLDRPTYHKQLDSEETARIRGVIDSFVQKGTSDQPPHLVIFTGGVGAGKTTIRRKQYANGYVHCEYGEVFNAIKGVIEGTDQQIETCAKATLSFILQESLAQKKNIVTELIGNDSDLLTPIIDKISEAGYKVEIQHITADVAESYKRHLKAVGEDENYLSAYYSQEHTLDAFYRQLNIKI